MNVNEIEKQGFILALFIRDDKKRFLLGSGAYEFKDSQLHFSANIMANDIVEVQGNDGCLLAGQVRRPTTQVFDGYIGDATVNRSEIENYRKDFLAFFQKNHFYTVVYVFPDGSTIQRRRGFIVDCGEIKELYQIFPTYHIGVNFEDVNYYKYSENDLGEETYGKLADIGLSIEMAGGLVWEDSQSGTDTKTGVNITFDNSIAGDFEELRVNGDTEQTTYSGKNLLLPSPKAQGSNGITASYDATTGTITLSGVANNNWSNAFNDMPVSLAAGTYTFSATTEAGLGRNIIFYNGATNILQKTLGDNDTSVECVVPQNATSVRLWLTTTNGTNYTGKTFKAQLEAGNQASSFEPYVGIASPNPDYPQTIHTVSGEQTITISDGNSQSQEYEINLGKNLFDNSAVQIKTNATFTGTDGNVFTTSSSDYRDLAIVKVQPNTKLTFSINDTSTYPNTRLYVVGLRNTTTESGESFDWLSGTSTITTGNNTNYLGVIIQPRDSSNNTPVQTQEIVDSLKIQLEFGSVKTTYAPYFTPIELCKIGTYQDYIYKSGDDWYVHKETKKVNLYDTKDLPWWKSVSTVKINWTLLGMDDIQPAASKSVAGVMMSDHFTNTYANALVNGLTNVGCAVGDDGIYFSNNGWDAATFKTYITNNIVLCYFALKNATDTQITDNTLIGQLEAVLGAGTYNGTTVITVSGADLASPLTVEALVALGGGVEWDNYGAVWEEGGGGMTVVNVDSIENVYPVWTVVGPTNNPTLENLTTNTTITYSGNVALGQKLVVDMLNGTAKLNGTSVIGNISGKWLEFAPGNNRINYTATNADAPNSTIEWQEIVG